MAAYETNVTQDRWLALLRRLGLPSETATYGAVTAAYSERHRHYHTAAHIGHCLTELDTARDLAAEPDEVELALWFHDAVYDPHASNNEEKSADWACDFLRRAGCEPARVERVKAHVLATRHEALPADPDSQLLVDIDLAILGAAPDDYAIFEQNVRKEYRWVPSLIFCSKRAEILQSFLDRPHLYNTQRFRDQYEARARANLTAAITSLRSR